MKKTVEFDEVCQACSGTGLYSGISESEGAAVVCYKCDGTGCYHFKHEYEDFAVRIEREDIVRVFECNPGIKIDINIERQISLIDFGGMAYSAWNKGESFPEGSENRKFTCPAWWYQTADYGKKPDWCECNLGGSFSNCDSFPDKRKCWERFDGESG